MEIRTNNPLPLMRLLISFIVACAVFVGVFSFAYSVSYLNYQQTVYYNHVINSSLNELRILSSNNSCEYEAFVEASSLLDVIAGRISLLEERLGKTDSRVLEQKRYYSEMQLEHLNMVNKYNNRCGTGFKVLLFFYSNSPLYESASDRTGYILEVFKGKYPSKVMIYSFDIDLKYEPIELLKQQHSITTVPVVITGTGEKIRVFNIGDLKGSEPSE